MNFSDFPYPEQNVHSNYNRASPINDIKDGLLCTLTVSLNLSLDLDQLEKLARQFYAF